MPNVFRPSSLCNVLLCGLAGLLALSTVPSAHAQVTMLDRQLSHIDIGVSGVGEFTNTVTGTNYLDVPVTQKPSNTLGALVTVRYTKAPYLGFEFNYGYARYTQNFTTVIQGITTSPYIVGGAQTNATEYTLGYVAHTPSLFGIKTFVSAGLGSTAFRATPGGGQGLPTQARATYYYDGGFEDSITSHFGIRAQFRQAFFLAPDFGQNYLTIKQRQITTEPGVGFYIHF
ncbi:hypothetical protein [Granulicella arctica]|uniref:Outer membrane protein beta-barrel domain-containing protein n=1 Tax=Granulicella arctica TaxID=940613 RepID=A0A7Y9PK44_9BACT|nr:hypothetical protein [Granulicella arctica]NYF81332.1 hypothetical protein [Granulicella arctica]